MVWPQPRSRARSLRAREFEACVKYEAAIISLENLVQPGCKTPPGVGFRFQQSNREPSVSFRQLPLSKPCMPQLPRLNAISVALNPKP